jgi:hypothetical protein
VNGDFEIELSALLAVSNKANISITVDPQVQALMKLVWDLKLPEYLQKILMFRRLSLRIKMYHTER